MEVTPLISGERQLIQGYGPGGFRISGERHVGSVLVFPDRTLAWSVTRIEEVTVESLAEVTRAEPAVELLVLGSGPRMALPPAAARRELRAHGVVIEPMSTPAGCRTYNVLMAEDRRVAAALMAMPEGEARGR